MLLGLLVVAIALALAAHPKLDSYDLTSLRYVMWCATPVTQSVAEAVTAKTGVNWVTAYGTSELPAIIASSRDSHAYRSQGHVLGDLIPIANANHFTILDELRQPNSTLTRAVIAMADY